MPDLFNDNNFAFKVELHTIIAGTNSEATRQIAPKRLGAADGRPFFQAPHHR